MQLWFHRNHRELPLHANTDVGQVDKPKVSDIVIAAGFLSVRVFPWMLPLCALCWKL
jgi:hypothetical protein